MDVVSVRAGLCPDQDFPGFGKCAILFRPLGRVAWGVGPRRYGVRRRDTITRATAVVPRQ